VTGGPQHEYRLKESFYLTKVDVRDKEDAEGEVFNLLAFKRQLATLRFKLLNTVQQV